MRCEKLVMKVKRLVTHLSLLILVCIIGESFLISANGLESFLSWERDFDFHGYYDRPISVQQTQDSGYIILGRTYELAGSSYLIIKTDSEGSRVWSTKWGGDFHIYCVGESIISTDDGAYIILGIRKVAPSGYASFKSLELSKVNSNGTFEWVMSSNYSDNNLEYRFQRSIDEIYVITMDSVIRKDINGSEVWRKPRKGILSTNTVDGGWVKTYFNRIQGMDDRTQITLTKYFFTETGLTHPTLPIFSYPCVRR